MHNSISHTSENNQKYYVDAVLGDLETVEIEYYIKSLRINEYFSSEIFTGGTVR